MKKNLKNLFSEDVQKILSQESIDAIEKAINDKVELAVEAALLEQDEQYAEKLQSLIKSIDQDHTKKMKRIVESVDKDRTAKLVKVIKKYEREQNQDLTKFKKQIVESVGMFIDTFIDDAIPKADFAQAVKNKNAYTVLENLRKVFAIDLSVMSESIAPAIMEGKQELDKLREENTKLKKISKVLKEQKESAEKQIFIESKVADFSADKRKFIVKALADKPLEFVKENLDYTSRLFDKQDRKNAEIIKEEAIKNRKHKPDFVKNEKVVTEKVNKDIEEENPYVAVMKQSRF